MYEIRTAEPSDYDAIAAVVNDWWQRDILPVLPRLFLDHFWHTSRVAVDGRGLAGFLVAFVSPSQPEVGYIHFVGVRPDLRRTGLARELYAVFENTARESGCSEIHAITSPLNDTSIAFHRRLGFHVEVVDDYNGPRHPMAAFRRRLEPSH